MAIINGKIKDDYVPMTQKERVDKCSVKNVVTFLLLTLPFFPIGYLTDTMGWTPKVYTLAQIGAGIGVVYYFLKDRLIKQIPKYFVLIAALLTVMITASALNTGTTKRALEYSFATIIICLVIEYGILKDIRSFLVAEMIFFGSLTVLNHLTILLHRGGMYKYLNHYKETWLLGFKSGHIPYQIAFLFFAVIYAVICDMKKIYIFRVGAILVFSSSYLVKNSTAMVILAPLIILAFFPKILKLTPVLNIVTYTVAGAALNIIFVLMRRQDMFKWLIEGVLGKSMDLTKRVYVWDKAFDAVRLHPVIGHGYDTFKYNKIIITTHNEIVEILYKTGIIGLGIFLMLIGVAVFKLFKSRKTPAAQWISVFLGAYFFMFVMEQHAFANFFYIIIFAYHAGELSKIHEKQSADRASGLGETEFKGRTGKAAHNFIFTIFANITAILIGLMAQKLFIDILGLEYAGLNGLFTNVITALAIVDLGIGEAVIFHLYKPLRDNDRETVKSLMLFYRRAFHVIAAGISVIGVCLIPFLPYIAKTDNADINLGYIYMIYLADTVLSYFLSYKRAIIYADQKNYKISFIHMIYLIGMNTGQLAMLYFTHDYYIYLVTKLIFRVLENVVITAVANREYPFLRGEDAPPLDEAIHKDIKKKTGALIFHKIGTFIVNGTDSILISVFFSLSTAGLYNNYFIVIDAATKLFNPALTALTPSVGNLLVSENKEDAYKVFRKIRFMNFWIAAFAGTSLMVMLQPFVGAWFGEKYLLSYPVIIVLSLQFFQFLMRGSYNAFQDAAGIFYENRFVPVFESVINLAASILFLKLFGLAGVFMGTIASSMALWCFSYPRFVYTRLFGRSIRDYARETLGYLAVFLMVCGLTVAMVTGLNTISPDKGFGLVVKNLVFCAVIPNAILFAVFRKSDCLGYFMGLIKGKTKKAQLSEETE